MNTTEIGRRAEAVAVSFLQRKQCTVLAQNWRTRWCEIDIVAQRGDTVYFCEVKYRRQAAQGSGLDYITPKKLQQMRFAAELWVHSNSWDGQYELCAIEVTGAKFAITDVRKDL